MSAHFFKLGNGPVIDDESGTIRQVSLMELGNAEGHFDKKGRQVVVDETTLRQVYDFCIKNGNLKVKADHGSGVMATIGWADNFALTANKVTADFHIYETEPQRPRIIEMARKNPDHLGMSLEFDGEDDVKGDHCLARCVSVFATALVSDPAANKSLFSAAIPPKTKETTNTNMDTKQFEELSKKFDDLKAENAATNVLIHKFAKKFEDDEAKEKDDESDKDKKDLEEGGEDDDKDKKELDDEDDEDDDDKKTDDKKEMSSRLEKAAQRGAAIAIKEFSAKMGITTLPKAGAHKDGTDKVRTYSEIVDAEVANFNGDRVKAEGHVLSKLGTDQVIKKAYETHRAVKTA